MSSSGQSERKHVLEPDLLHSPPWYGKPEAGVIGLQKLENTPRDRGGSIVLHQVSFRTRVVAQTAVATKVVVV